MSEHIPCPEWLLSVRPELGDQLDLKLDGVRFSVIVGLSSLDLPISYKSAICAQPFDRGAPQLGALLLRAVLKVLADPTNPGPLPLGVLGPWQIERDSGDKRPLDQIAPEFRVWRREAVSGLPRLYGPHTLFPRVREVADRPWAQPPVGWSINRSENYPGCGLSLGLWREGPEVLAAGRAVVDGLLRDHRGRDGRRYGYVLLDELCDG